MSERKAHLQVEIPKLEEDANGGEEMVANPEPDMMMLNRDLVVRLAEQHHLAITIRPNGSNFGLTQHLDRLRTLVKGELTRATTKRAGGGA